MHAVGSTLITLLELRVGGVGIGGVRVEAKLVRVDLVESRICLIGVNLLNDGFLGWSAVRARCSSLMCVETHRAGKSVMWLMTN